MAKAQVGDLIRVVNILSSVHIDSIKLGGIYEVISLVDAGVVVNAGNRNYTVFTDEYEIHRKAGEEDDANPTQLEPSRWSDTQEHLIRLACSELADLLVRKNHDYGDSFSQQYGKYGLMSALIRMDDKMRRLETLQGGEQAQVAESVGDTLQDLAGYALLAFVESKKK